MLNGRDPLLIITLKNKGIIDFFGPDSLLGQAVSSIGIPIPIYLSEKLTGIYVDSQTKAIDVTTKVEPVTTKDPATGETEPPNVSQTCLDAQIAINLIANQDAILLTALLAIMEQIVSKLVSAEYSIHYINGPIVLFGGLLHRFSTSVESNSTLTRMELILSTAAKEAPTPKSPIQSITKQTGTLPL